MKIKEGFILREIADSWVVVPIGQRVIEFNGLMTLSESGALLWDKLQNNTEPEALVNLILAEYDTDKETAKADVSCFISQLYEKGLIQ